MCFPNKNLSHSHSSRLCWWAPGLSLSSPALHMCGSVDARFQLWWALCSICSGCTLTFKQLITMCHTIDRYNFMSRMDNMQQTRIQPMWQKWQYKLRTKGLKCGTYSFNYRVRNQDRLLLIWMGIMWAACRVHRGGERGVYHITLVVVLITCTTPFMFNSNFTDTNI